MSYTITTVVVRLLLSRSMYVGDRLRTHRMTIGSTKKYLSGAQQGALRTQTKRGHTKAKTREPYNPSDITDNSATIHRMPQSLKDASYLVRSRDRAHDPLRAEKVNGVSPEPVLHFPPVRSHVSSGISALRPEGPHATDAGWIW